MKEQPAQQAERLLADKGREGDLDLYFDFYFGAQRPPLMHADRAWHPPADLYETESEIVVRVDIAGINPAELTLVYERGNLLLSGTRQEPAGRSRRQYHKMEVPYGPFERVFKLPAPVCPDSVHADYKDGLLTVTLQKKSEPPRRRRSIRIAQGKS